MRIFRAIFLVLIAAGLCQIASGQAKRTVTKTDSFAFGAGGTVTITGSPQGSVTVLGANANSIEISAQIHLEAASEAELDKLKEISGFITDDGVVRTNILTSGPHNKFLSKKLPKGFSKSLLNSSVRVDYVITVPRFTDLQIDGGSGDLSITGVEGSMRINFIDSKALIEVIGGDTSVTLGSGSADISFGSRGWRGRSASVQVGKGDLTVRLPSTLSAELDAVVIGNGSIENELADLKVRDRKAPFTEKAILAKAGVGGTPVKFSVGDGKIRLTRLVSNRP